jgi:hypothetical protein
VVEDDKEGKTLAPILFPPRAPRLHPLSYAPLFPPFVSPPLPHPDRLTVLVVGEQGDGAFTVGVEE